MITLIITNFLTFINLVVEWTKRILSFWNYLIIKNQINPSLCFPNINPYLHWGLSLEVERKSALIEANLIVLKHRLVKFGFEEGDEELIKIINEKRKYEHQKIELSWYISFLIEQKKIFIC